MEQMSHSSNTTSNNSHSNLLEALQAQVNQQQKPPIQNALNTMTERQFNASLDALAQGQIGGGQPPCFDSSNNQNNNNDNNSNLQQLAQIPTPDQFQQQQPSAQYYQAIAAALTHSGLAAANFANANLLSLGNSNLKNNSDNNNNDMSGNNTNANGYNGIILPPSQLPTGPLSFPGISNFKNDNNSNPGNNPHPNNTAFKVSFSQSSMDMGEDMSEASKPSYTSSRKRFRNSFLSACAVSEDEGDREKRRKERNIREQQRYGLLLRMRSHSQRMFHRAQ